MSKIYKLTKFFILILLSILALNTFSVEAAITELPNQNQTPKMITMSIFEDSKTQMAFNWNTDWETNSDLEVVLFGEDFSDSNVLSFSGTNEKSKVDNDGFIHRVVATNLTSGTKYSYRLGDKELDIWSKVGSFTTAKESGAFNFVHISDPQGYEEIHYTNYKELLQRAVSECNPSFFALSGDIVNDSYADSTPVLKQWDWALTMQEEVLLNIPVMTSAGNHDAASFDYISRFNHPASGDGLMENGSYYSYDYQNVHFVVLNTNDSSSSIGSIRGLSEKQINWLVSDLEDNESLFTIVMMHKGIYDAGGHCSNMDGADGDIAIIRNQLTPIFSKYNVDLVLQGHDHLYSRSYPINGEMSNELILQVDTDNEKVQTNYNGQDYQLYQNPEGTIYLNSGTASGSKYYAVVDYNSEKIPLETSDSSVDRMFTNITIDENNLYATVYKLSNGELTVFDTFGITKTNINSTNSQWIYYVVGAVVIILAGSITFLVIRRKKDK